MPDFQAIPKFPRATYQVHVPWKYLESALESFDEPKGSLDLSPDYQRAHVWTEAQQQAYVEYLLQGGEVGCRITFNSPGWQSTRGPGKIELVDGKQRLEAVRKFLRGELAVFGHPISEWENFKLSLDHHLVFQVTALETREEVLQFYLNINAGGTPHTQEELDRVQSLLNAERSR